MRDEQFRALAEKDKQRYVNELQSAKGVVDSVEEQTQEAEPVVEEGYQAFAEKMRKALKKKEPDATDEDIAKRLSCLWKDLDDDARAKFAKQSKKNKK